METKQQQWNFVTMKFVTSHVSIHVHITNFRALSTHINDTTYLKDINLFC